MHEVFETPVFLALINLTTFLHQVEVEGLHSSKTYDIAFSPVGTLPHTVTIRSGSFLREVPWGEIPGRVFLKLRRKVRSSAW